MLFDALGTLVELDPPAPSLRRGLARRGGLGITAAEAEHAIAAEIAYYRAHLDEGRDQASLARLRRRCAAVLRAALPRCARGLELHLIEEILLDALRFEAFDDARPALRAARQTGSRVVVVSNWDISLEGVLEQLGLASLLDGVITSASAGARKPSPKIFSQALELAAVPPERALHIGDSLEEDVEGARSVGIAAVLVRRDGSPGPPGVRTISTLAQLRFARPS